MNSLSYPPVYLGIYLVLITAILSVVQLDADPASFVVHALFWGTVYAVTLRMGPVLSRKPPQPMVTLTNQLSVLALVVFLIALSISGLADALILFLITVQAIRNLSMSTRRDLYFAYLVSFFLITYASSVSKSSAFVVYLIFYVLAVVFTLMAEHIDERLSGARGGDRATVMQGMSLPVNVLVIAAAILGCALVFYVFLPRPPSLGVEAFPADGDHHYRNRAWEEKARRGDRRTDDTGEFRYARGTGEEAQPSRGVTYANADKFDVVNPGEVVGLGGDGAATGAMANPILFYLQAPRPLYVRGRVFNSFDGRIWHCKDVSGKMLLSEDYEFILDDEEPNDVVTQIYTVNHPLPAIIYSAYRPKILNFPAKVVNAGQDSSLRAPESLQKGTRYSVRSSIEYLGDRPSGAGHVLEDSDQSYLQLPDKLPEEVTELSATITRGLHDDYDRAVALEQHLRASYQYTRATIGREPPSNLIEHFLFQSKEGHCEIFASTLVMMLRAVGIPARFVTGFYATTANPVTGYYEVGALNAHAWVEAYISGFGWVTFEPTPPFELPKQCHRSAFISSFMDYLKQKHRSNEILKRDDRGARLIGMLVRFWEGIQDFFETLASVMQKISLRLWSWFQAFGWPLLFMLMAAAGLILMCSYLGVIGQLRTFLDRQKLQRARKENPRAFMLLCYASMERMFARHGLPRKPGWTHWEYERRLAHRFRSQTRHIQRITELFGLSRYSLCPICKSHVQEAYGSFEVLVSAIGAIRHRRRGFGGSRVIGTFFLLSVLLTAAVMYTGFPSLRKPVQKTRTAVEQPQAEPHEEAEDRTADFKAEAAAPVDARAPSVEWVVSP